MDVPGFLEAIRRASDYDGQIVHEEVVPARSARYGSLSPRLDPRLEAALARSGVHQLYLHQSESVQAARDGENLIVATGAASGKSLCYQVPLLESALGKKASRSLLVFPTKALAQNQLRSLNGLCSDLIPIKAEIFDGDTPGEARSGIKRTAQAVITNPDMLHLGILPNHGTWQRFFRNLDYVVIDEAHAYTGVFGSHMANVIRRLRRLAGYYGSSPSFILCSATVANPRELAEDLLGAPVKVIDQDHSPQGGKHFLFWNPPFLNESRTKRRSAIAETAAVFRELLLRGVRTLTFTRTRRQVELVYVSVRDYLAEHVPSLVSKVSPYRASYLAEDRRAIEQSLFNGELLGVASTNALELGIDVGTLDATILGGYPGSVSSAWQQAGRSGRRQERSLSVLVARNDPLDQYLMRHPEFFFGRSHEHALIAPNNPRILDQHLLCAAYERPLGIRDERFFGLDLQSRLIALQVEGLLHRKGERWFPSASVVYPAEEVNIRSSSRGSYAVVSSESGALLEMVDEGSAFSQLHTGAVYLHYGEQYLVERLDLDSKTAYVSPRDVQYYTRTHALTDIQVRHVMEERSVGSIDVYLGEVEVSSQVVSYQRMAQFSDEPIGDEILDLPPQQFSTVALWFNPREDDLARIKSERLDLSGGLHAAEHAAIGVLPLFALCDRNDIGGVSTPFHPDTGRPQIFIYDGHAGGVGIAEKGYQIIEELWRATLQVLQECPCEDGCPACIQSPKCGNNNHPLDKGVAAMLLRGALGL